MKIEIDGADLERLSARYGKLPRRVKRDIRRLGRRETPEHLLETIHLQMGGPGPNVITGEYLASIKTSSEWRGDVGYVQAGSDAPQAARLEYGFFGRDSLGRNVHQEPRPHFRPALLETQDWYMQRAAAIIQEALG